MLWGLTGILALLGGGLLSIGLRGRRVGSAAHCRGCGFELTGILSPPDAAGVRCPECGREIGPSHAPRIGRRVRRPKLAIAGCLGILGAGSLGLLAASAGNAGWNAAKPTWLLLLEAEHVAKNAEAAGAELLCRHAGAGLTDAQLSRLVDPAIRAQGDAQIDWRNSVWFEILEMAFVTGAVSERQRKAYARTALAEADLPLPQHAVAGAVWPVRLYPLRLDFSSIGRIVPAAPVGFIATLDEALLDGQSLEIRRSGRRPRNDGREYSVLQSHRVNPTSWGLSDATDYRMVITPRGDPRPGDWLIPRGQHTLVLRYTVHGYVGRDLEAIGSEAPDTPPTIEFAHEVVHTITGHESAAEFVRIVDRIEDAIPLSAEPRGYGNPAESELFDPTCHARMGSRNSIELSRGSSPAGGLELSLMINRADSRPDTPWIIGRLELRSEGRAWRLLPFPDPGDPALPAYVRLAPRPHVPQGMGLMAYLSDLPRLETADLVIVPDLDEAGRVGTVGPLWGREIVIPDVALNWTLVDAADGEARGRSAEEAPAPDRE